MPNITLPARPKTNAATIACHIRKALAGLSADDKCEVLFDLDSLLKTMHQEFHDEALDLGLFVPNPDDE